VGVAWDVFGDGRTSVRAGFGIYHDQPFGRMYNEMTDTLPFNAGVDIDDFSNGTNISAYNPYAAAPYNGTSPSPNLPTSSTVFPKPLSFAIGFSPIFKAPATLQWNLSAERQLSYGIMVHVGYEASDVRFQGCQSCHGWHLPDPAHVRKRGGIQRESDC
jgi:hypothetical protein